MKEFFVITYKGKQIHYIDYSNFRNEKEKALQLLKFALNECKKFPPKSSLTLINLANLNFDTEVINAFKDSTRQSAPYVKKVAIIGIKGLQKVVYNFIASLTQQDYSLKAFDSELEAKEWLIEP